MKRAIALVGLVLVLAALLPMCVSQETGAPKTSETPKTPGTELSPITIRIKSGPTGTTWYSQASALAGIIEREIPGSSVTVETGSAISNIVLVEEGKTDVGFTFASLLPATVKGEVIAEVGGKKYFEEPTENVRVLCYTSTASYVLITTADKGWKSVEDLKGKPIRFVTYPHGFVARYMGDKILEAHGITHDDIKSWGGQVIIVNKYREAVDLLAKGQADVIVYTMASYAQSPALTELEAQKEFTILKLSDSAIEKLTSEMPVFIMTVKKGLHKSIKEDINVISDVTTYLVPKNMPEETAYTLVKMIVEHRGEIAKVQKEWASFEPKDFVRMYGKAEQPPLHPGAMKYFKEIGVLS